MKVVIFDSELRYIIEEFVANNRDGLLVRMVGGMPIIGGGEEKTYEFDYSKTYVINKVRTAFYKFDGTNYIQIGFKEASAHGTLATYIQQWNYAKIIEDTALKPPKDEMKTVGILMLIINVITVIVFAYVANNWLTQFGHMVATTPAANISIQNQKTLASQQVLIAQLSKQDNATLAATQSLISSLTVYLNNH